MKKSTFRTAVALLSVVAACCVYPTVTSAATDKLVVEDAVGNKLFSVDDAGNMGVNNSAPNYAADIVSNGAASRSQLHFSLDGADEGGFLTSVLGNNFWISSGAAFDQNAGGWIQKSADGQSVFFGSGAAGFRAFLQEGNTQGQPLTNVNVAMLMDYSGNMKVRGGLQMNNSTTTLAQPACTSSTRGMLWMTKGTTDALQVCAQKSGSLAWYPVSF